MGSISATVPVLLTNAPIPAVTSIVSTSRRNSLFPAIFTILPPIILASPVLKMAPPTTKSPTIITTMELEKPESACSGPRMPNTIRHNREHNATISERILPWTNRMAETPRIISVVNISNQYSSWKREPFLTYPAPPCRPAQKSSMRHTHGPSAGTAAVLRKNPAFRNGSRSGQR